MAKKSPKKRLDLLVVEKALAPDIKSAFALIMAGEVVVNEQRLDKPGALVSCDSPIRLKNHEHSFVSRGALKLEHALKTWPINLSGAIALDVGASTGGFSEILLNNDVAKVYAVDVGYGQLAHKLRIDERVVNLERTNIIHAEQSLIPDLIDIAVIDVSFISLERILPKITSFLKNPSSVYALVKPQFELDPEHIAKGGLVLNEDARLGALEKIINTAKILGFEVIGSTKSPILGAKGNEEYLLALKWQNI